MKLKMILLLFGVLILAGGCTEVPPAENVVSHPESQVGTNEKKKILILFFSRSGNTKTVAKYIQELTGGELVAIEPVKTYSEDDNEANQEELNDRAAGDFRAVKTKVENMAAYDVLFVGYPIWTDRYPCTIPTILKEYDLSGKIIVPFCTYYNSRDAGSFKKLADMLPDSFHRPGLAVKGSNTKNSQKKLQIG